MTAGPRVGIPPCLDDAERIRAGRRTHYLDAAYARAVVEAGGLPLYLPAPAAPDDLLEGIDALLVPGGDDLLPAGPLPVDVVFDPVSEAQLAFDRALLSAARARALPVLGICYGLQLLVDEAGGTLVYDIPSERPEAGPHRLPEPDGRHPLLLEPGARLAAILGADPAPVNSLHHQGVAAPGAGLRVAARSGDGLVEAVEAADDARFVVGVQWHPEKMTGPHRERLFAAFVDAARARRGSRA